MCSTGFWKVQKKEKPLAPGIETAREAIMK